MTTPPQFGWPPALLRLKKVSQNWGEKEMRDTKKECVPENKTSLESNVSLFGVFQAGDIVQNLSKP
jgi:hypothetical protein